MLSSLLVSAVSHAAWFDNNWAARQEITISSTVADADLTNYPYLVRIVDPANELFADAQANGNDIVFTAADGITQLSHEIELYDAGTNSLYAWVRVPLVSSSADTTLFMYYDYASALNQQDVEGTWDNDYVMVQHLQETSGTHLDSTNKNNDGTPQNGVTQNATGQVDGADQFDNDDDLISVGASATLEDVFDGGGTLTAWMRPDGWGEGNFGRIADKSSASLPGNGWALELYGANSSFLFQTGFSTTTGSWITPTGSVSLSAWQHVALVYDTSSDANDPRIFIDGVEQTVTELAPPPSGTLNSDAGINFTIGNHASSAIRTFHGPLDEVRVSTASRSAAWIRASYRSQNAPDSYLTLSAEQPDELTGTVFEDVNYGGGMGRDRATAATDAPSFIVGRGGVTVELYNAGGNFVTSTATVAGGSYSFSVMPGTYTVRVVNGSVTSSRPGSTGSELAVQTYRIDGVSEAAGDGAKKVGGELPSNEDAAANSGAQTLASLQGTDLDADGITEWTQSIVTVDASGGDVSGVDFGYNFDTIVNTNDTGQGSLRQFILNSNSLTNANLAQAGLAAGLETSLFRIPVVDLDANGVASIRPAAMLQAINDVTGGTRIDGATQTSIIGDTNAAGPEVELDGSSSTTDGLTVNSANNSISGLIINGFDSGAAIEISGAAATGNTVLGCYIGTNFDASAATPNTDGVSVVGGANDNTIGGAGAGEGNVVSGNNAFGILISGSGTDSNTVIGNRIGTDGDGTFGLGNLHGVTIRNGPTLNDIGGTLPDEGNLISGNDSYGVYIFGSGSNSNTVVGNRIGTAADGESDLGGANNSRGVHIASAAQNNTIGGTATGEANVIAHNDGPGVDVAGATTDGNIISGNSIFENSAKGIDLNDDGANDDKPVPVVNSIVAGAPDPVVRLSAVAGDIVELFRATNPSAPVVGQDATLAGEGYLYLGRCVDNGACSGPYVSSVTDADPSAAGVQLTLLGSGLGLGDYLSATATDPTSGTSEFSVNAAFALKIVKRAFQLDGTPIASGSTLPAGVPVKFLLYVDNPGTTLSDASLQDVLNVLFAYEPGSIKVDDSLDSATVCPGGVCNEVTIFAKVDGTPNVCGMSGSECTDTQDTDPVSLSGTTIHAGDGVQVGNAQLDFPAGKIWALSFTIGMQ